MKKNILYMVQLILAITCTSCEKFLNVKATKNTVIPETLNDLQALLDNGTNNFYSAYPPLLELGTDDYALNINAFNRASDFEKEIYTWDSDPFYLLANINANWGFPYKVVFLMNVILEDLNNVKEFNIIKGNAIKGGALFYRAFAFYCLAQVFCEPYDKNGDNTGHGIPLRLTADFNEVTQRASVEHTYDQILKDLEEALSILPVTTEFQTRPNKVAAMALLSRIYLSMEDYEKSLFYADEALKLNNGLIDLNTINVSANIPYDRFNKETIVYVLSSGMSILNFNNSHADLDLYNSYDDADLRKTSYYSRKAEDEFGFKGSYSGVRNNSFFIGLTTSELYLNRAECYARLDKKTEAIEDLNYLRMHRWKKEDYKDVEVHDSFEALVLILEERRKEMVRRGTRWTDLRRLNKDPRFAKILKRKFTDDESRTYTLSPNDVRYVYPIPQEVIIKTGIPQNKR